MAAIIITFAAVMQNGSAVSARAAADSGSLLNASYQTVSSWGSGYTGQYTITNTGSTAVTGWTLAFRCRRGRGCPACGTVPTPTTTVR